MKERTSKKMYINSRGELKIISKTEYTFTKKETLEKLLNETEEKPEEDKTVTSGLNTGNIEVPFKIEPLDDKLLEVLLDDIIKGTELPPEYFDSLKKDNTKTNKKAECPQCSHHKNTHLLVYFDNRKDYEDKIVTCQLCGKRFKMLDLDKEYTTANFTQSYANLLIDNFLLYKLLNFYSDKEFDILMKIKASIAKGYLTQDDKDFLLKIYNKIQTRNLEGHTTFRIPLRKEK